MAAHGGSKNGITPLISSIHDDRITGVRSNVAFTAFTPIRANDSAAVAEVARYLGKVCEKRYDKNKVTLDSARKARKDNRTIRLGRISG